MNRFFHRDGDTKPRYNAKRSNTFLEDTPEPTLDSRTKRSTAKKRMGWSLKKKIIISSVCAVAVVMLGVGAYAYAILQDPMGQFENVAQQFVPPEEIPLASQSQSAAVQGAETVNPSPTPNAYDQLVAQADFGLLDKIVNVLLIGVDHAVERDTWSGKKAFHADVMIVLAINTDTGAVDMISLPRDTYANIPGVEGIYKLNASIDCGGGWPTEGGFNKVCEAASWMVGGIPVQYYYAVDMNAVKGLADAIGGVDYDVDIDFKIQGRSYTKGMQHLDGQGVLDYLRVRKNLGELSGDKNRVDRQKRMLVAIFEKLKASNMLVELPGILGAFNGNLYTNTTLAQTAGLAAFAYHVDSSNISIHSMGGQYRNIFNWNFLLTDQEDRVALIKQIYGVDVPIYEDYTAGAASAKWASMQRGVVLSGAKNVLAKVKEKLDADARLPIFAEPTPTPVPTATQTPVKTPAPTPTVTPSPAPTTPPTPTPAPPTPTPAATDPPTPTPAPTDPPTPTPAPTDPATSAPTDAFAAGTESVRGAAYLIELRAAGLSTGKIPAGYRQYGDTEWGLYNKVKTEVSSLKSTELSINQLKADVARLCSIFNISIPSWRVNYEKNSNEIWVDFN